MDGTIQLERQNNQLILNSSDLSGMNDNNEIVSTNAQHCTNKTWGPSLVSEPVLDQIDFQREAFYATLTFELLFFSLHWLSQMTFHVLIQHSEHSKLFLATLTLKPFHCCMYGFEMIFQVVWLPK